jgi:hypothetical protein
MRPCSAPGSDSEAVRTFFFSRLERLHSVDHPLVKLPAFRAEALFSLSLSIALVQGQCFPCLARKRCATLFGKHSTQRGLHKFRSAQVTLIVLFYINTLGSLTSRWALHDRKSAMIASQHLIRLQALHISDFSS